jgi:hypothetical protein
MHEYDAIVTPSLDCDPVLTYLRHVEFGVDPGRKIVDKRSAGSGASRPLWRSPAIVSFLNP